MEIDDYRGNRLRILPDGSLPVTLITGLGALMGVQNFSVVAGGTAIYTPSVGVVSIWVRFWGAGGGGGGALSSAGNATLAQAAGSGGYSEGYFSGAALANPLLLTFGAPGISGDITGSAGSAGGDSMFDTLMTIKGGLGGLGDAVGGTTAGAIAGALGGSAGTGGSLVMAGGAGFTSFRFSAALAVGGRGGIAPGVGFQLGRDAVNTLAGGNGFNFGAGGGAAVAIGATSRKGGDGAPARCYVFEFGA